VSERLKVLHITPTYFSPDSVMGGGERYVHELALAMAKTAEVTILTFGKENKNYKEGEVSIHVRKPLCYIKKNILNPLCVNLYTEIKNADIVHIHQIYTVLAESALIWSRLLNKPVFLTDHGGGGTTYLSRLGIAKFATGLLPVSEYSGKKLSGLHLKMKPVYGGVNPENFQSVHSLNSKKIISLGRILPHKGFHHLIEAIDHEELTIIGRVMDKNYFNELNELARNKNVRFLTNADDKTVKETLSTAALAVFPSTDRGLHGEKLKGEAELLGIAPLEAMAMNLPTLVSDIGAYPEICADKKRLLFRQGDVQDLREKIKQLMAGASEPSSMEKHIQSKFTWEKAANACLQFYKEGLHS